MKEGRDFSLMVMVNSADQMTGQGHHLVTSAVAHVMATINAEGRAIPDRVRERPAPAGHAGTLAA